MVIKYNVNHIYKFLVATFVKYIYPKYVIMQSILNQVFYILFLQFSKFVCILHISICISYISGAQ